jgi:hypothetical protein
MDRGCVLGPGVVHWPFGWGQHLVLGSGTAFMFDCRNIWRLACLVGMAGLAFVLLVDRTLPAGGKKTDEKKAEKKKEEKKDQKKPEPLLDKSEELKAGDERDTKQTKSPRKVYPVKLIAGKKYQIDLKSKDFDAYLRLLDSQNKEVAFNDDSNPATFDSRIVYQPASTGVYKIVVTSYDGKSGKFTVTAVETDKKTPLQTGSRYIGQAIELKLKDGKTTRNGELTEQDRSAFKRYYQIFTVRLEKDKSYRIFIRANDAKTLDARLFLEDADGAPLDSASSGEGGIVFMGVKSGSYRLIATSAREGQTGRFTLDIGPAAPGKKEEK